MKKSFLIKIAVTLICLMSVLLFTSCFALSEGKGDKVPESETNKYIDEIDLKDCEISWVYPNYKGYTFTFLTDGSYNSEWLCCDNENSSSIISDGVYRRNNILTQDYHLNFAVHQSSDIVSDVRTQVLGGSVDFDVIIADGRKLAVLAREGLLCDPSTIEKDFYYDAKDKYIDYTDPHWDSNSIEQLSIGGKTYFMNCAMNIGEFGCVVYYNKELIKEYDLRDPAEYVKDGTWTIDNWAKLVRAVGGDVDKNGEMTELELYGTLYERQNNKMFLGGIGESVCSADETGYAVTGGFNIKKASELYMKLKKATEMPSAWFIDDMSSMGYSKGDKWDYIRTLFCRDRYLFYYDGTSIIHQFQDMESDWGIAPFPKFDEKQENYYSLYPPNGALVAVPAVMNNGSMTAFILDGLNYYSYIVLKPALFDTLLSRRYARDDSSEAALEALYENRVYDIAMLYDFGGIYSDILNSDVRNNNIETMYARKKTLIEAEIKAVYRDFGFEVNTAD